MSKSSEYPKTLVHANGDEHVVDSKADEVNWKFRGYAAKPEKTTKASS